VSASSPSPGFPHSIPEERRALIPRVMCLAAIAAGACRLFLLALSAWNLAASKWQNARNPVPGKFFSIDGRQMHLCCQGPMYVIERLTAAQIFFAEARLACTYDTS